MNGINLFYDFIKYNRANFIVGEEMFLIKEK